MSKIPAHLRKYIVQQNVTRYTPIDHAVWRFIMKQLSTFLGRHAHECYTEGLAKTGIDLEEIPSIDNINKQLQKFGWSAVPVSGFIPPAAFMELQSLGILPIASDMRTIDHLDYTPAPDIVHEAAGHAPILIHPEFSDYLHQYAQVASKAILNKEDLDLYEAIRDLSDIKENPTSTKEQIAAAEKRLNEVTKSIQHISEGALLARMNWWTAEYGLIGDLKNPKIYGAGLLSSVGESRSCLTDKVEKIPFSIDCINYAYDITEQQPQLFVTPDFKTLNYVLEEFAQTMAYRIGGTRALEKARISRTVNTIELNSGLQIAGILKSYKTNENEAYYLQFEGPTQLAIENRQLQGHGKDYHNQGFGSPVGKLRGSTRCLSQFTDQELKDRGIVVGKHAILDYQSGVRVQGQVNEIIKHAGRVVVITFVDARAIHGDEVFFAPEWGPYDMAVGSSIPSVFGGPADRIAYGDLIDFLAKRVPPQNLTPEKYELNKLYAEVRKIRKSFQGTKTELETLGDILADLEKKFSKDWLLKMEIFELSHRFAQPPSWQSKIKNELLHWNAPNPFMSEIIRSGVQLSERPPH